MHITDRFVRLLLRIVDAVANAIMSARLRIVDWIYGPEPPTPADRQRETEKGRLNGTASPWGTAASPEGRW
jgi:hypothetical protein